jgi:hypothetical protein
VTSFYLEPGRAGFADFAASPLLGRLEDVDFPSGSLPVGGLAQVVGAGHLPAVVRNLELSHWPASHAELDVFVRGKWPRLRSLFFHRCGLDDVALAVLARLQAPQLEQIRLVSEGFGLDGVQHLLGAAWVRQLVRLDLVQLGRRSGLEGLAALVDTPLLANLRRLNLGYNPLGPTGLRTLAGSPHLGLVRHLDLSYADGGAPGLLDLFNSPTLCQVRTLFYGSNGANFDAVADRPVAGWPRLRTLYISSNPLGDRGLSWLLDRSLLRAVRDLWITHARLTGVGFVALLRSPLRRSLVSLNMGHNPLGPLEDLPAVADLPRLRELELESAGLGDRGAGRLVRALRAPELRELILYENDLGNETAHAVASNASLRNLEKLSLSYHPNLDDEGARLLEESPYLERLTTLQLFETGISDQALARLRRRFRHVSR